MNLSQASERLPPRPARVVVLPPSSFRSEWSKRPTGDAAIGIRLLSEQEVITAQAEAFKVAKEGGRSGDAAVIRYQEELFVWAVSLCATNPNDERKPWFLNGVEEVALALTPEAVRHIWDELELAHVAASPTRPPINDNDLPRLRDVLTPKGFETLPPAKALRVRKWLAFILAELTPPP